MQRFLPLMLVVSALGCTTFGGHKTASNWYALEKAGDVTCEKWPLREKDLQVDDLMLVRGQPPGILASGLKRDASPQHYFARFDGDPRMDAQTFVPLEIGRQAVIVGGATVGGQPAVLLVRNAPSKATLEVRSMKGNVVLFKGQLAAVDVIEGATTLSSGGAWISFKTEDNTYHLAFLDLKGSKPASRVVAGLTFADRPQVIATPSAPGALVIWKDGESTRPFKLQAVNEDGTTGAATALAVTVAAQVESWSAVGTAEGPYLAMIDGDSLIGQAELKISHVNWADGVAGVAWTHAAPLKDVHATEPVLLVTASGVEALLLNWIDEESTIARYMVAGGSIGKPAYSGVYPKGTRILEAFTAGQTDVFVIVRNRDESRWAFQVCEL